MPPLDNDELALHISAWAELLFSVIPESKLGAAYVRAVQESEDTFTLTAPKLIQGFRALCDSERSSPRIAQDSNLLTGEVCQKCFGLGWEQYIENGYKQVRKCDHVAVEDPDDVSMF